MAHSCIVNTCKYHKKKNYNPSIMFHSFPLERERSLKWIESIKNGCKKEEVHATKHSKICQMHFLADDYMYRNDTNQTKFLKNLAIPSVFMASTLIKDKTNKKTKKQTKINNESSSTVPPLQQNTNVLNYKSQSQSTSTTTTATIATTSSSTSPSSYADINNDDEEDGDEEQYTYDDNYGENNQLEIASDTNDDSNNESDNESETTNSDDQLVDVELNESSHHNTTPNNQIDVLNTSSRSNSAKKRFGLSDVINKLQSKQQQQSSSSSLSSLLNNLDNNELSKQQQQQQQQRNESPESASISSVVNSVNSTSSSKTNSEQPLASISSTIIINQSNKSEIDLYRLLERANLLQYFNKFTEKGIFKS